ncbi:RNA processing protein [Exophiala dermatitidis]|nr:RNA processing protein [Exophiala dermatitidis]
MLVELKNGETLNGHLVNCDTWMNLTLKEVVQTSPEGDRFWRLPEAYVRGNNSSPGSPNNTKANKEAMATARAAGVGKATAATKEAGETEGVVKREVVVVAAVVEAAEGRVDADGTKCYLTFPVLYNTFSSERI